MILTEIDHVAIAVHDLEAAIEYYKRAFGAEVHHREVVERDGVEEALIKVADSYIQLTTPTRPDSTMAKALEKRGEGIHHVAFRTDTIGEDLQRLANNDIRLINTEPQNGAHDMLVAFLHPSSTGGVLMELCSEKP